MKKSHFKWGVLLVLPLLSVNALKGQVTIGSGTAPASHEKLRIEGKGQSGLRLTKFTAAQRDVLETKMVGSQIGTWKDTAKGLVIYNTTSKAIEFWNGEKWLSLESSMTFVNGLRAENGVNKLGGTLTKNTAINQTGKDLSLNVKTGGELSIDAGTLTATNTHLAIGTATKPAELTIKSPANVELLSVKNTKDVAITASQNASFDANASTLIVDKDKVAIPVGKDFYYLDGNEGINTGLSNLVLESDANGNAKWKKLEATTTTLPVAVLPRTNGQEFATGTWTDVTSEITLTRGKWLIIGRYVTYTGFRTNDASGTYGNYLGLLRLFGKAGNVGANAGVISVTATIPEKKNHGDNSSKPENNSAYASPTMTTYLEIDTDDPQKFVIDFFTDKQKTWVPFNSSWVGAPQFRAIQISKQ